MRVSVSTPFVELIFILLHKREAAFLSRGDLGALLVVVLTFACSSWHAALIGPSFSCRLGSYPFALALSFLNGLIETNGYYVGCASC